jgi:ankyrin repeat protein
MKTPMNKKIIFYLILCVFTPLLSMQCSEGQIIRNAIIDGNFDITQFCLEKKPVNFFADLLCLAAARGHAHIIQSLINYNKEHPITETDNNIQITIEPDYSFVNLQSLYDKWTALHCASASGHWECVQLLCNNGANVNLKNVDGATALFLASQHGHVEVVKCLLQIPTIETNISEEYHNENPLHRAAEEGYTKIAKLLLQHTPTLINLTNKYDYTPLMLAIEYDHTDVTKVLLKTEGVDVNKSHDPKWKPLDYALKQQNTKIIPLLLAKGAISGEDSNKNNPILDVLSDSWCLIS